MENILDNEQIIAQKDPGGALGVVAAQFEQAKGDVTVKNPENDGRAISSVVVAGMGGSALAALLAKVLLQAEVSVPFEIIRGYDAPAYVSESTLVIASSYSGNTEETLTFLQQAQQKGSQIGIITSGGALLESAVSTGTSYVVVPTGMQPRMATISNLRALLALLNNFGIVKNSWLDELAQLGVWLQAECANWLPGVPTEQNYAKQLAVQSVGKIPVFYGGATTAPLAYKFKISWNETAKNVAFWNEYPEFNHNEFMGWTSHPIEKPFVVFDLISSLERPRILQRFELSDRLLSGQRPHASSIQLKGDTLLAQLLWGAILADFASTYTGILNGVDPTPVALIENLKRELNDNPR